MRRSFSVIQFFGLINGIGSIIYAQLFKDVDVHLRQYHRRVTFRAAQRRQLFHRPVRHIVGHRAQYERNENFIGMKTRIVPAEMFGFKLLYGLDEVRRKQQRFIKGMIL